jgi:hypothetical protein
VNGRAAPLKYKARRLRFAGGGVARLLQVSAGAAPPAIVEGLGIEPSQPVVVLAGEQNVGGPADVGSPQMRAAARQGADAAAATSATIIDGGVHGEFSSLVGRRIAERSVPYTRLGVASVGRLTPHGASAPHAVDLDVGNLEPHHSHFVVVEGAAEAADDLSDALADELSGGRPGVLVLAGGGPGAMNRLVRSVRRGWPIVVLQGTGGLADELARAAIAQRGKGQPPADPVLAEVLSAGDLQLFPTDHGFDALERFLVRRLEVVDPALRSAWEQFALYDHNAVRLRQAFQRLQLAILALGILGTLLALTQAALLEHRVLHRSSAAGMILHYVILLIPIALAVLLGAAARFRSGNRWVVLRGAAEAVKREIYRYRTRTGPYTERKGSRATRRQVIAEKVSSISSAIMGTDVNLTLLREPGGQGLPPKMFGATSEDDGFSELAPDEYLARRVGDQLGYYRTKSRRLERQLRSLQWLILVIGGVGTLLAALRVEVWIALTTALVAAITTYLGYEQVEATLANFNQAAAALTALRAWWGALPPEAQQRQSSRDRLVAQAERILQKEQSGWVQDLTDALAELRVEQEREEEQIT